MSVWLNGALLPDDDARISVFDHGLVAGDGVFETVKVSRGAPFALSRHLTRLGQSAAGLGLPEPDTDQIRAGALAVIDAGGNPELARLRITMTAGTGPLSSERAGSPPTVIIALAAASPPGPWCDVVTAPWPRNERGALVGLKTTSYADNVRALSHAARHGGGEAIFGNTAGSLCEGTGSNVFVVTGGRLVTPPLSAGCLAGVTRALVLDWVGASEEDLPLSALAAADEAFLTGTTRDVQPIRRVDGVTLPASPGPITKKAAEVFAMRASETLDP